MNILKQKMRDMEAREYIEKSKNFPFRLYRTREVLILLRCSRSHFEKKLRHHVQPIKQGKHRHAACFYLDEDVIKLINIRFSIDKALAEKVGRRLRGKN